VAEGDEVVDVGIRPLLVRQLDVAADRAPAHLLGPAIGRFHDAGPAAGHDRESPPRQPGAHLAAQFVVGMLGLEAGGAEHGDAGPDPVQRAEAPQELEEDPDGARQLEGAGLGALQEADLFRGGGSLAPLRSVRGRRGPRGRLLRAQARYSGPRADWTATTETLSGAASSRGRWLHV